MNEIWKMETGWSCVYSEDPKTCERLTRSKSTDWFGTYTKGNKCIAEQFRFPNSTRHEIDQILGSVTPK